MSNMDENIRKILESQDTYRRYTEPLAGVLNVLNQNTYLKSVVESQKIFDVQNEFSLKYFDEMHKITAARYEQFKLPEYQEAISLVRQYEESGVLAATRRMKEVWSDQGAYLQRAMGAMHQPWLDAQNITRSFGGFAEVQSIGYALSTKHPFEEGLASQLRESLGDWQGTLDFVSDTLVDPLARTEFYLARGFDSALTDFPENAFLESTSIAGLRREVLSDTDEYDVSEPRPNSEEESLVRTNAAHDRLMRFELHVRRFIDERMSSAFGGKWIKQRVPHPIRQAWEMKRQKALDIGESECPLIAYADFTDYVTIITRKDNWDEVFAPVFLRSALVQESFQRLYPIRICTMHARLITQDDDLYLLVETQRLLKAMKIS